MFFYYIHSPPLRNNPIRGKNDRRQGKARPNINLLHIFRITVMLISWNSNEITEETKRREHFKDFGDKNSWRQGLLLWWKSVPVCWHASYFLSHLSLNSNLDLHYHLFKYFYICCFYICHYSLSDKTR